MRERQSGYTQVANVETLVPLLAAGGDCLDDTAVAQADMTEPLHAVCATLPEPAWVFFEVRPDETVTCTEVEFTPCDGLKDAWPIATWPCGSGRRRGACSRPALTPSTWRW